MNELLDQPNSLTLEFALERFEFEPYVWFQCPKNVIRNVLILIG